VSAILKKYMKEKYYTSTSWSKQGPLLV